MRTWIAVGLLCLSFVASSQDAQPSPANKGGNQTAPHDTRGTAERPLVVVLKKEKPTPAEQAAAEDEWKEKKESLGYDKSLATWTIVLSIATIFLMGFTGALYRATSKIATGTREDAQQQHRAYIGPEGRRIFGLDDEEPVRVVVQFKNYGVTPARKFTVHCDAFFGSVEKARLKSLEPPTDVIEGASKGLLFPGEITSINVTSSGLPEGCSAGIELGMDAIYVWGRVDYEDVFGKSQWTTFSYVVGGEHRPLAHTEGGYFLAISAEGNDAS